MEGPRDQNKRNQMRSDPAEVTPAAHAAQLLWLQSAHLPHQQHGERAPSKPLHIQQPAGHTAASTTHTGQLPHPRAAEVSFTGVEVQSACLLKESHHPERGVRVDWWIKAQNSCLMLWYHSEPAGLAFSACLLNSAERAGCSGGGTLCASPGCAQCLWWPDGTAGSSRL